MVDTGNALRRKILSPRRPFAERMIRRLRLRGRAKKSTRSMQVRRPRADM